MTNRTKGAAVLTALALALAVVACNQPDRTQPEPVAAATPSVEYGMTVAVQGDRMIAYDSEETHAEVSRLARIGERERFAALTQSPRCTHLDSGTRGKVIGRGLHLARIETVSGERWWLPVDYLKPAP